MIKEERVQEYLNRELDDLSWIKNCDKNELEQVINELNPKPIFPVPLFTHQLASFYLCTVFPKFTLWLDMGLGKSLISLCTFFYLKQQKKVNNVLICVPRMVNMDSWEEEIKKHTGMKPVILRGTLEKRIKQLEQSEDGLYVINYAGLAALTTMLVKEKGKKNRKRVVADELIENFINFFDMLILDEVQACRNHNSIYFEICSKLSIRIKHVLGMTGTPIGRDATKFWAQFYVVDNGETLGDVYSLYMHSFFNVKRNRWGGVDFSLKANRKKLLYKTLKHRSIRYSEKEAPELPPLTIIQIPIRMHSDARALYSRLEEERLKEIEKFPDRKPTTNYYTKMRQICSGFLFADDHKKSKNSKNRDYIKFAETGKVEALLDVLEEMPDDSKAVIFHFFVPTGKIIEDVLKKEKIKFVNLANKKSDPYKRFKEDPKIKVLIINIESGGEGINLQIANYAILYEMTEKPDLYKQVIKRIHRTAQEKRCFFYKFVTLNSIEEKMVDFVTQGRNLFNELVEGKEKESKLLKR